MLSATGCVTTSASARAAASPIQLPPVAKATLENGLTVLVTEHPGSGVVALYAVVKVGSASETPHLGSGISHFVEHMLFKGTEQRPPNTIGREVADLGGDSNGQTSFDETAYVITVPRAGGRPALEILADMLLHASFPPEEVAKEREVIRNEIRRGRDDPQRQLHELLWGTAFRVHAYRHTTIGYEPEFNRLTREDLLEFHKRYYTPDNMVVSIAGDVRAAEAIDWARELFADVPRGVRQEPALPSEPTQLAERHAFREHAAAITRVAIGYQNVSLTDPDLYALDLLASVLGQGESALLVQRLQYEKRLVHSIDVASVTPRWPGLWVVGLTVDPDRVQEAIAAVDAELARIQHHGLPSGELERAKQQLTSEYLFGSETDEALARRAADGEVTAGDPNFASTYLAAINRLTADDLMRVAARYLRSERRSIAVVGPATPFGRVAVRWEDGDRAGIVRTPLSNGAVLLSRDDPQLPLVSIRAVFKGGLWGEAGRPNGVAMLTARLLARGTKRHTASEIASMIESIGGRLDTFSGNNSFGVSLDLPSTHAVEGLALVHELLTEPAFDPDELEGERRRLIAAIHAADDNVFHVAQRHLRRLLYPVHPYGNVSLGTVESVQEVHHKDLARFAAGWLRPDRLAVSIFGCVEPAVLERAEALFGGWSVGDAPGGAPPAASTFPAGPQEVAVAHERAQAVVIFGLPGLSYTDPDKVSLDVLVALLSGMDGRLYDRVRQQFGLAYVVGASAMMGYDTGFVSAYAATAPEDAERVAALLRQELARCASEPVPEEELVRVKRRMIGLHHLSLQSNAAKALQAALDELLGVGADYMERYPSLVEQVAADDLLRVARRCLVLDRASTVLLSPSVSESPSP